jgi:hypothetical protein
MMDARKMNAGCIHEFWVRRAREGAQLSGGCCFGCRGTQRYGATIWMRTRGNQMLWGERR